MIRRRGTVRLFGVGNACGAAQKAVFRSLHTDKDRYDKFNTIYFDIERMDDYENNIS